MSGLLCDKDKIISAITVAWRLLTLKLSKRDKCSKATIKTSKSTRHKCSNKQTAFAIIIQKKKRKRKPYLSYSSTAY